MELDGRARTTPRLPLMLAAGGAAAPGLGLGWLIIKQTSTTTTRLGWMGGLAWLRRGHVLGCVVGCSALRLAGRP